MLPLAHFSSHYRMSGYRPVQFSSPFPKMLVFTLATSSLTSSNLPWFMDLTFLLPIQCCSLLHQTLLSPPDISTTDCYFCFAPVSSFFRELFLNSTPVAYWTFTDLADSSSKVISFCLFILFIRFSRQEYQSGLLFPSPVDHALSELSTVTHLFWAVLHGMAHSFTELHKALIHVIILISFLWLGFSSGCCGITVLVSSVCILMDEDKRLVQASW